MAKPKTVKTAFELASARVHVNYERDMLKFCADTLSAGGDDSNRRNALLESFAIHTRSLMYFLFTSDVDREVHDDMVAEQFVADPAKWDAARGGVSSVFHVVDFRAGKEVAHLTYERLSVGPISKAWDTVAIATELLRLMTLFDAHARPGTLAVPAATLPRIDVPVGSVGSTAKAYTVANTSKPRGHRSGSS